MKMKTTTLLPLSFLLFLCACTFSASANSAPDPVRDVHGKILRAGVKYYVKPAFHDGKGGGLALGATGHKTCPLGVKQLQKDELGLPLVFSPVNPKKGVIRVSTDLNIKFWGSNSCHQSNVWKLNYDQSMKKYFVMVGGVEGNPGKETVNNWFKIEKTKVGYKLVFCPSVCKFCKVLCKDIGITLDDKGTRRLALSDVPFNVIFVPMYN